MSKYYLPTEVAIALFYRFTEVKSQNSKVKIGIALLKSKNRFLPERKTISLNNKIYSYHFLYLSKNLLFWLIITKYFTHLRYFSNLGSSKYIVYCANLMFKNNKFSLEKATTFYFSSI